MIERISGSKTTILFISSFASLQGGGQRSLLLLLRTLDRQRFIPRVIVPEQGELSQACATLNIPVDSIAFPRLRSGNVFAMYQVVRRLQSLVRSTGARIIHADAPRETWYALPARRSGKTKIVFHARVSDSVKGEDWLLSRMVDAVICVSRSITRRFSSRGRATIHVVYNSADPTLFQRPVSHALTGSLRIGYFGRLHPRKGLPVLIQAVNSVGAGVTCIIKGSGDLAYEQQLHGLAGAGISFRPYSPDASPEMAAVDAVVLPDRGGEGLSRMLIEAMALGKAVIASDFSENREVFGEELREWLFPAGDAPALAERLQVLMRQREQLVRLAALTRQRAQRLFQAEKNTRQIEQVYEQLLGPASEEAVHA